MGKATNETIKTRVAALKALILSGSSNSTCVAHAAQQWGLSRRQSYRLLKRAWAEVREDVHATGVDRQEMICWVIHQLMTAAGEGVKHKQPSVTVGACRELDALLGLGHNSRGGRFGWRRSHSVKRVVTDEVTENINARNMCAKSFIKNTFAFRRTDAQVHIVQLVEF